MTFRVSERLLDPSSMETFHSREVFLILDVIDLHTFVMTKG